MKQIFTFLFTSISLLSFCQADLVEELSKEQKPKKEYVAYTFKTTRVINGQSVEMVKKNALDFRISHRFGDMLVKGVSGHTLLGLDNATDILLSFEYGILDDLTVGVGRSQGAGPVRELYNGFVKYRALKQTTNFKIPVTVTFMANSVVTSMKADPFDATKLLKNESAAHRFQYMMQAIIACKATNWLSLQLTPTFLWRNYVATNDQNALFFLGLSGRAKFTKRFGMVFEYNMPLMKAGSNYREYFGMVRGHKSLSYYPNLHVGIEIETGGHVFHINFTNSAGLIENDYMPYNDRNWLQGQIRLGFSISRMFQFGSGKNAWTGKPKKVKG